MPTASIAVTGNANVATDTIVGGNRHVRRPFSPIMRTARRLWKSKVPEHFAAITGKSTRSCERWLAGHVDPDGPSTLTMIFAEPAFLDAAVSELSLKEQARFWKEVEKGAKRNLMRIQRAELDEKIKAMDAGE